MRLLLVHTVSVAVIWTFCLDICVCCCGAPFELYHTGLSPHSPASSPVFPSASSSVKSLLLLRQADSPSWSLPTEFKFTWVKGVRRDAKFVVAPSFSMDRDRIEGSLLNKVNLIDRQWRDGWWTKYMHTEWWFNDLNNFTWTGTNLINFTNCSLLNRYKPEFDGQWTNC